MDLYHIISETLGWLGFAGFVWVLQMKDARKIIAYQALPNFFLCLHLLTKGAVTGAALTIISVIRNCLAPRVSDKHLNLFVYITIAILSITGLLLTDGFQSVIIIFATAFSTLSILFRDNASRSRLCMILCGSLWLVYGVSIVSFPVIFVESSIVLSGLIGGMRHDNYFPTLRGLFIRDASVA